MKETTEGFQGGGIIRSALKDYSEYQDVSGVEKQGTEANWGTFTSFKKKSQKLVQRGGNWDQKGRKGQRIILEVESKEPSQSLVQEVKKKMFISSIYGFLALVGG